MITSLQHPLVKKIVKLQKSRSERYEQKLVIVEGTNMLCELLERFTPVTLLACDDQPKIPWPHTLVSRSIMAKISDCEQPPGLLAVLSMPAEATVAGLRASERLLVLDGIADPGNMGTLLRSARAFGWSGVLLLPGCSDPYNPKAIRAAKGATFGLMIKLTTPQDLTRFIAGRRLLIADLHGQPFDKIIPMAMKSPIALLLGNEAHGVSQNWPAAERVTIPISSDTESLNVAIAGSILMERLRGQQKS